MNQIDSSLIPQTFQAELLCLLPSIPTPLLPPFIPPIGPPPPDQLLQLVSQAYTCNDNALRLRAEKELRERENKNFGEHMKTIFQLIFWIDYGFEQNNYEREGEKLRENQNRMGEKLIIYAAGLLRRSINLDVLGSFEELVKIVARNIACLFRENMSAGKKVKLAVALEYLMGFCTQGDSASKFSKLSKI